MEGLSQALAQWGNLYRAEGNYDRARDCLYQSLELRRELGDRRGVGRSLNNLGVVALYAGNPQRAYAFFAESMNLFESMNDLPGIAATLENQGHEALFLERWNEAKRAYERSVALAHEMGGVKRECAFDLRHIGLAARGDGGAVARTEPGSTAFGHRRAPFLLNVLSIWADRGGADEHVTWVKNFTRAMEAYSLGVYVNFLGDEGDRAVRASYDGDSFDRLVALKTKYDPTNLFRLNQNIRPNGNRQA